jgi:3-phosphoglycerate kinase
MKSYIKEKFLEVCSDFNDFANLIRDELQMPQYIFDLLTRQNLNEKELTLYKNDLNKKKDEFFKKSKKKQLKPDEDEKELNECKLRLLNSIREKLLDKYATIERDSRELTIHETILNSYLMDEEYIERLARVKCLKTAKLDGLEGKTAILRVDIDEYEPVYENIYNEEGLLIGKNLKEYKFPNLKENVLQTMFFLLDNRVKAVVLLVDFGPKLGSINENYKIKYVKQFIEPFVEQMIYSFNSPDELEDVQKKIDSDEVYKDNSLMMVENLNFFPEECGYEKQNDPLLNSQPGTNQHLKFFTKLKFVDLLSLRNRDMENKISLKNQIFVNDSLFSILKKYPSVIDMQCEMRCLGLRLETQLHKVTNFLSINSNNFMLIIGDMWRNTVLDDNSIFEILLTINCLLSRFKIVFIVGKIALYFIQFIQNDYVINQRYIFSPIFHKLVKYILVRADLNNVKIILPEDGKILIKKEVEKFKEGSNWQAELLAKVNPEEGGGPGSAGGDENNNLLENEKDNLNLTNLPMDDYVKFIKKLTKMEKIMNKMLALNLDPEDLNENEEYLKNKINSDLKSILANYKNNTIEFDTNTYRSKFISSQETFNPKKTLKNELESKLFLESIYHKPVVYPTNSEEKNSKNQHKSASVNNLQSSNSKFLFDNENFEFIDYGEKTYDNLIKHLNEVNGVMWFGKLSPSIIENLYDHYSRIVRCFYERKQKLRNEFNELMLEEEKKLQESDLKAKKYLYTIFLKSKTVYDIMRYNYLQFILPSVHFILIF